jgi:enoyl-CoA hydratase/carnithine racemase
MSGRIEVERSEGVAHVCMNRPEKKNALDDAMFQGLIDAAKELGSDPEVRAVVISGAGGCFSSGLDFSNFGAMASGELDGDSEAVQAAARDLSRDGAHRGQQIAWLWRELPVPVVAAVEGVAFGGGLHIALGADIRLMAPDARIAFVEITWGLVPDLSATQGLRSLVSLDVAKRMMLTGDEIDGRQAHAWGLATELSERPLEHALDLAGRMAHHSPDAVRAGKWVLERSHRGSVSQGLADEMTCSQALMGTPNQLEAVVSKLGKREPDFGPPAVELGPVE